MLYEVITDRARRGRRGGREQRGDAEPRGRQGRGGARLRPGLTQRVITSYSIHYTKLYDIVSGLVTTYPISIEQAEIDGRSRENTLENKFPEIYKALLALSRELVYENLV